MKPKIIKALGSLDAEMTDILKQKFPFGYKKHLITFTEKGGKYYKALPLETEQFSYLIKIQEGDGAMCENSIVDAEEDLAEASFTIASLNEKKISVSPDDVFEFDDISEEE